MVCSLGGLSYLIPKVNYTGMSTDDMGTETLVCAANFWILFAWEVVDIQ
jgi:hypothetical protein